MPHKKQRQGFPDLIPQAIGSGYAGITSGRVLNAKNSTASRSSRPSGQVWERVAAAASSSSTSLHPRQTPRPKTEKFPALPGASSSSSAPINLTPAFRQPTRTTPWSASANAAASPRAVTPRSVPASIPLNKQSKPPKLDKSLFPELPSSSASKEKPKASGNQSLKNILGNTAPAVSAWQAGSGGSGSGYNSGDMGTGTVGDGVVGEGEIEEGGGGGKKGKKGKGKQKQTLFTLGTFPT